MVFSRDNRHLLSSIPASTKVVMKRFSQKLSWEVEDQEDQVVLVAEEVGGSGGSGAGGGRGGWMWPPRSYSCSFCRREFRSAQALGGHMNVHRRDRALLKQVVSHSSIDHHQPLPSRPSDRHHDLDHRLDLKSSYKSMAFTYASQQFHPRSSALHLSPSRVSSSYNYSQSNVVSGLKKVITTNDVAQVKMSVGLDFSRGRYWKEEDEEGKLSSKRCKKSGNGDGVALLPFFDEIRYANAKGNPELPATKSMEGLDLELRLGFVSHAF